MKGVFQLLKESFRIYKSKITVFLGIMSPAAILIILGTFIPLVGKEPLEAFIIAVVLLLTAIFIWLLSVLALLYAIKDNLNPKNAYKKSFLKIKSFLWVSFLLFVSEIILFITFSTNFLLAIYVFIFEEKKGMKALFQSEQLIAGISVLWQFKVFGFILFAISLLFYFFPIILGIDQSIIMLLSYTYIVGWLVLPFFLIYGLLIYKTLRETKGEVPYQEPGKGKKIAYLLIGILGLFLALPIFGMTANIIYRGDDIPPINDSDLRLSKIEIPREDNAFYYFVQAGQKVYIPTGEEKDIFDDIIDGKKWDEVFVRELLEKNKEAFYYLEKGIQLPYFQHPALQNPEVVDSSTLLAGIGKLRELARIKSMRAIYLFSQGEEEAAFEQSIQIIQMGQLIQDSPRPLLITYLVGMAIKGIGLETLRIILSETEFSSERLKDYVVQLKRFKLSEQELKTALKMEYISTINTIEEEFLEIGTSFIYKPNLTRRWVAEHWRSQIDNVVYVYRDIEIQEPEILLLEPLWKNFFLRENLVSIVTVGGLLIDQSGAILRKCEEDFSINATQILMAIKAYQIETGKIPSSLEELVPEFIFEIPKDPFDGQPIRFSSEKKIIWSVDENLIDENGTEDDITFKIEF
jgi:MFS family permease